MARVTRTSLHGVWHALLTPWTEHDELDEARFVKEIRAYEGTGVHGLYTGGTTGEFYAQDDATFERITVTACAHAHAIGLPIQIGVTALSTRVARGRTRIALAAGADGIQAAIPFWLELKDDEIVAFFDGLADAAGDLPLILYNTSRAKRKVPPELLGQLARMFPTFIGIKDTGCDVPALKAILAQAPALAVFGSEHDLIEKTQAGGRGTYSSVTGLNARRVVELYEHCAAGRFADAKPIQDEIYRLLFNLLVPMMQEVGLSDSAIDRVQRAAGGGDVGLRCQGPYRSAGPEHVQRVIAWCRAHAPRLLPAKR